MVLNSDVSSVNLEIHGGLEALLKQNASCLQLAHCINHRVEIVVKDAFKTTIFTKTNNKQEIIQKKSASGSWMLPFVILDKKRPFFPETVLF